MELVAYAVAWKYRRDTKPEFHRIVTVLVGAIIAMCLVGTVFSELWPVSTVLVMQFLRGFQFFKYFEMMYVANYVVSEVRINGGKFHALSVAIVSFGLLYGANLWKPAWVALVALIGLLIFYRTRTLRDPTPVWSIVVLVIAVMLLSGGEFVKRELSPAEIHFSVDNAQERDWLDVQRWAKHNTEPQDYFIVPPTIRDEFRDESDRPVYGDWEDGGLMNGNPAFGHEWFRRMTALGYGRRGTFEDSFKASTEKDFLKIAKEVTISRHRSYLVEDAAGNKLNFPISYENPKYIVYDVYQRSGSP